MFWISTSGSDDLTTLLETLRSRCCRPHGSRILDGRRRRPQCIMCHECSLKGRSMWENVHSRRKKRRFKMNRLDGGVFLFIGHFRQWDSACNWATFTWTVSQTGSQLLGDSASQWVSYLETASQWVSYLETVPHNGSQLLGDSDSNWVTVTWRQCLTMGQLLGDSASHWATVTWRQCLKLGHSYLETVPHNGSQLLGDSASYWATVTWRQCLTLGHSYLETVTHIGSQLLGDWLTLDHSYLETVTHTGSHSLQNMPQTEII